MTCRSGLRRSQLFALPQLVLASGTVEGLKWLGATLMTIDHVNKYLFNGAGQAAFAAGRLAMPIFSFVLAYNLARPDGPARGLCLRTACRLLIFGLLATPAFIALGGPVKGIYPLNVLFALLAATTVIGLLHSGRNLAAIVAFSLGGALVEFWWPAIGLCVAVWLYAQRASWTSLALGLFCIASLQWVNGNAWALAVLPVFLLALRWELAVPRWRWFFYAYYPLHLAALWLIRIPLQKAGYLFF